MDRLTPVTRDNLLWVVEELVFLVKLQQTQINQLEAWVVKQNEKEEIRVEQKN